MCNQSPRQFLDITLMNEAVVFGRADFFNMSEDVLEEAKFIFWDHSLHDVVKDASLNWVQGWLNFLYLERICAKHVRKAAQYLILCSKESCSRIE